MTQVDLFKDCDVVFLSYDEPAKKERFERLKNTLPSLEWIDGIKGFDEAHRQCGEVGSRSRVLIIDGDNSLLVSQLKISQELFQGPYILSFASKNSINHLEYGNGGLKCWPRELLKNVNHHQAQVDFVYTSPYYQMGRVVSLNEIDHTKEQAFRAGFREGVKMALVNGKSFSKEVALKLKLDHLLPETSLYRLRTWCQIGLDQENGFYAILGARQGLAHLLVEGMSASCINDYDWLNSLARDICNLSSEASSKLFRDLRVQLCPYFKEELHDYNASESELYKSAMVMPLEVGPVQKAREFFNE